MTEHVHVWTHNGFDYEDGAYCADPDCKESLDREEITRRLNATERLSEWMWLSTAGPTYGDIEGRLASYQAAFEAYAAALEDSDD